MSDVSQIAAFIKKASAITVLTGAGVSTASGIPDFRSASGVWTEDRSREYYMSTRYFSRDPVDFWKRYKEIFHIKLMQSYKPNLVHTFLKELEKEKQVYVVTQNVDGLHQAARSSSVIEYHGSLRTATCPACGSKKSAAQIVEEEIPRCDNESCQTIVRPDIVLFGDRILKHSEAEQVIDSSDFILTLGTSLQVSPFNLLPEYAVYERGLPAALLNGERTMMDSLFTLTLRGDLSQTITALKKELSK
ncbi:NAD-dependent protein deacylase [Alkalihalobacillus sp. FSL W8-0930]